jgi:caspase domain-containing protein
MGGKHALLVGIDHYAVRPLASCVNDAKAMAGLLANHEDGSDNFKVSTLVSAEGSPVTRQEIVDRIGDLLAQDEDADLLFYYSGHGRATVLGPELVAQEEYYGTSGISMDQLAAASNRHPHKSLTIILDCCFAGGVGQLAGVEDANLGRIQLARGMALLAASREDEVAFEGNTLSIFTSALLDGLNGAAADIHGRVTPAGLHTLADASLSGPANQQPVLKVYSDGSALLRQCTPTVSASQLAYLQTVFEEDEVVIRLITAVLGPEDGIGNPGDLEAAAIRAFVRAGLIVATLKSAHVEIALTLRGRHYLRLVKEGLIGTV